MLTTQNFCLIIFSMNKNQEEEITLVESDKCVFCGKALNLKPNSSLYATVVKKKFPVCSEICLDKTNKYLTNDKKHKKHFYWMFTLCGILTFGGIIINYSLLAFIGVIIAGLSFLIFPYPISSFESFTYWPIKKMNFTVRIIGLILLLVGVFFLLSVISDKINVSFR